MKASSSNESTRTEKDSMGLMEVPETAYYGASTMRAVLNFPISNLRFQRSIIKSIGMIKQSCAKANLELGLLEESISKAIVQASQEVIDGTLDDHFVVDVFQTGSGTSTNMNANEVIANRATELLGKPMGTKLVHPNDHVNLGQSSNDVIPSAIHIAALQALVHDLSPALDRLSKSLESKSEEFWPVIKTGRTHLQDATPIRLGQEFLGFYQQVILSQLRLKHASLELGYIALGGTAVGTGINTHPSFATHTCAYLSKAAGIEISETPYHFQAQNTLDSILEASGTLRTIAVSLHKIANDIRWMGSGPRAGLGELSLPEVQPGSSIMPGKVNPVIAESLIQVVAHTIGNDNAILQSALGGYFELNTMMPVAGYNLLQTIALLTSSSDNFAKNCIEGLSATEHGPSMVHRGLAIGTALAPKIGYDKAAEIAKEAAKSGKSIFEIAKLKTDMTEDELTKTLNPEKMVDPSP